jgi:predicted RNase H-like nuclease
VDGCRSGWVVAWADPGLPPEDDAAADGGGAGPPLRLEVEVVASFDPIAERVRQGRVEFVAVDMPMGLAERDRRRCDVESRRLLGPRRSSVFPTPVRAVLDCRTYEEALSVSRAVCGRGLSKQAWYLVPKIRELDRVVRDLPPDVVAEVHPELAFAALTGAPMAEPKRTALGRQARLAALAPVVTDLEALADRRLTGSAPDDILDACALAWSARRLALGGGNRVGHEIDGTGLPMTVAW